MKNILIIIILTLTGKLFSQEDIPCNYLINETFSGSSLTVEGKKAVTSFQKQVSGLQPTETYIVTFYQLNNTPLAANNIPASSYWEVDFSGVTKKSPFAVTVRTPYNNPVWEKVTFAFIARSTTETITFTNTIGYSLDGGHQLLLADIRLYLQGECITNERVCKNISSFRPKKTKEYVITGWVKEERTQQIASYTNSGIKVGFGSSSETTFLPSGNIIDGWQQVQGVFKVPDAASMIEVTVIPASDGVITYFDDIRIHPFNGNMKSFVYDQDTQRLMAELDENNYATFYEYDKEGGLVRVKKETEKGIFTIQETRSSNAKL